MTKGNYSLINIMVDGEKIWADDRNEAHQNHIDHCNVDGVSGAAVTLSDMTMISDPFPGESPQVTIDVRRDIEQIRFQLNKIIGADYWYNRPVKSIEELDVEGNVTGGDLHDHSEDETVGGGVKLTHTGLEDNCITEPKLQDLSVSTAKLQDYSVTNLKLAENAVSTDNVVDGSITNAKLADDVKNSTMISLYENKNTYDQFAAGMDIINFPGITQGIEVFNINYIRRMESSNIFVEASINIAIGEIIEDAIGKKVTLDDPPMAVVALFIDNEIIAKAAAADATSVSASTVVLRFETSLPDLLIGETVNFKIRAGVYQQATAYVNRTYLYESLFSGNQASTVRIIESL